MFRLPLRRIGLSLIAATFTCGVVVAQDAESQFDDGIEAFRRGDNEAAVAAFKAVLASNPGNDEAYRLLRRVEDQLILEMMGERGELGEVAKRFLTLAQVGRQVVASDPGGANEVVAQLFDGSLLERRRAMNELQATYGGWAVPALLGPLVDSDPERRVEAQFALIQLGDVAVIPLLAALATDDVTLRTNVAAALGSLRDVRAASALAWLAQHDPSDTVKGVAATGVEKMRDQLASLELDSSDPMVLTLGLADRWLRGDADVVRPYDAASVRWTWDGSALQGQTILHGLYTLDLAESALTTAHDHAQGADRDEVRAWLAAVEAAKLAEIESAGELEGLDGELLAAAQDQVPTLRRNVALAGPLRGDALTILVEAESHAAAAMLARTMSGSDAEVQALRSVLDVDAGGLGVAAAQTLARLGDGSADVVSLLGASLASIPDRLVVAIGDTGLSEQGPGFHLTSTNEALAGLTRAKAFPPKDVVVLQDGAGNVTLDTLVFGLRNDPRSADVPIVIVTADVEGIEALYGDERTTVVNRASWDVVAEAAGDLSAAHERHQGLALRSAQALAGLPGSAVASLGDSFAQCLDSAANTEVQVAVLELVARSGADAALPAVERILLEGAEPDVQVAAMHAAARLWAAAGGSSGNAAVREALEAIMHDGDEVLSLAAAEALGHFGPDARVRLASH